MRAALAQLPMYDFVRKNVFNLCDVVADLDEVSTIDRHLEADPEAAGLRQTDIEAIWETVRQHYATGAHPGISISIRKGEHLLMSRAIGHAYGNAPNDSPFADKALLAPSTPMCVYSTSKAITAMLVHMLCEDGLIQLSDPVSFYAPEFSSKGKRNITIQQILAHRGGVAELPSGLPIDSFTSDEQVWEMLCSAKPTVRDGSKLSYHALTGGFIMGRVIQNVTGKNINQYLDERIRQPMGMNYFHFGLGDAKIDQLAKISATGLNIKPITDKFFTKVLGADLDTVVNFSNSEAFYGAPVPAGNLVGTANEVSAFFQMLLNDGQWQGKQICEPSTVMRARQEFGARSLDGSLKIPMRYSAGFMLGDNPVGLWGMNSRHCFGHAGFALKFSWADPERNIAVSLLNTGVPIIADHLCDMLKTIHTIGKRIPKIA